MRSGAPSRVKPAAMPKGVRRSATDQDKRLDWDSQEPRHRSAAERRNPWATVHGRTSKLNHLTAVASRTSCRRSLGRRRFAEDSRPTEVGCVPHPTHSHLQVPAYDEVLLVEGHAELEDVALLAVRGEVGEHLGGVLARVYLAPRLLRERVEILSLLFRRL